MRRTASLYINTHKNNRVEVTFHPSRTKRGITIRIGIWLRIESKISVSTRVGIKIKS